MGLQWFQGHSVGVPGGLLVVSGYLGRFRGFRECFMGILGISCNFRIVLVGFKGFESVPGVLGCTRSLIGL